MKTDETKKAITWRCIPPSCRAENYADAAGLVSCSECGKYYTLSSDGKVEFYHASKDSSDDEKILKITANIVLWLGLIATLVLGLIAVGTEMFELLAIVPVVLLTSIGTWAFFRVIANISSSLKDLNQKMKSE